MEDTCSSPAFDKSASLESGKKQRASWEWEAGLTQLPRCPAPERSC